MRVLKSNVRLLYYFISVLLFINPGFILSQDPGNYSEFRTEIYSLFLDYKLEEALALCNKSDKSYREVIAGKGSIQTQI